MTEAPPRVAAMRRFWDERARENAAWYVDTSLAYDNPDMATFFATGRRIVDGALTNAPVRPAGRDLAVEIGPGLGRVCLPLADHFDRVVGIDVSDEMVGRARQLVTEPHVEFVLGDGVSLAPLEDASADFVISFTVLQHLPRAELVLGYFREAARVLRPGGVLAIQWNNIPHPRLWRMHGWLLIAGRALRLGGDPYNRIAPEFIGTRIGWTDVARTLDASGMTVCGREGANTLYSWVWARKT